MYVLPTYIMTIKLNDFEYTVLIDIRRSVCIIQATAVLMGNFEMKKNLAILKEIKW